MDDFVIGFEYHWVALGICCGSTSAKEETAAELCRAALAGDDVELSSPILEGGAEKCMNIVHFHM